MKIQKILSTLLLFVLGAIRIAGQTEEKILTIPELFRLTDTNHPTLVVSQADVAIAKQQVEVAKNAMIPSLNAGLQGYFLGDAVLLDKGFSKVRTLDMPHFGNTFSVDANELLWKGGTVRNAVKIQSLREEASELSLENNSQSIKLTVLGYYLDLAKVINQKEIYRQNIELGEQRVKNIEKFYKQGMVTRNDVLRGQLQLSNLKLAENVAENNRQILNKQLVLAMGLPEGTQIQPDSALLNTLPTTQDIQTYAQAVATHPAVRLTQKAIEIQEVNKKITRAEMLPAISAFAGNRLARPLTSSIPAMDLYSNGWSAGLSVNWSIDNLYKTPKKLKLNDLEQAKASAQARETENNLALAVDAAYIKYNEAVAQKNTLEMNRKLAYENYRIMTSKYNNQLAILLDLIDASNAKLEAELQYANAEINVVYSYYKLLRDSGQLDPK